MPSTISRVTVTAPEVDYFRLAEKISLRIICPPIILWDITKFLSNKLFGAMVGRMVLPAQTVNYQSDRNGGLGLFHRSVFLKSVVNKRLKHNILTVVTPDGAELDTFEVKYIKRIDLKRQKTIVSNKYMLNFCGNMTACESPAHIADMQKYALDLQCNVVNFNYRGVNFSTGKATSKQDLITDGITQVQRLLNKGVESENIVLKGLSLGGAVATLVAKHFHDRGIKIYLFNDRSFSTIARVLGGTIRNMNSGTGHIATNRILGAVIMFFTKIGLLLTKWEMNAGKAFSKIPGEYKDYIFVRSHRDIRKREGHHLIDDAVITHYASLHESSAVKAQRKEFKAKLKQQVILTIKQARDTPAHSEVKLAMNDFSERHQQRFRAHKMGTDYPLDGHNASERDLVNRYGETATHYFTRFFQRGAANDRSVLRTIREDKAHNHEEIIPSRTTTTTYTPSY
jgi:hypothetical protein